MHSVCRWSLDKYALWADTVLGRPNAESDAEAYVEPHTETDRGPDTTAYTCAHSSPK